MMKIPPAVAVPARLVPPFLIAPFVSRIFFQVMRAHQASSSVSETMRRSGSVFARPTYHLLL